MILTNIVITTEVSYDEFFHYEAKKLKLTFNVEEFTKVEPDWKCECSFIYTKNKYEYSIIVSDDDLFVHLGSKKVSRPTSLFFNKKFKSSTNITVDELLDFIYLQRDQILSCNLNSKSLWEKHLKVH